jgi:hypothetical protein
MTEFQQEVITLLKQGLTPIQVCNKLNRAGSSVSSVIKRFNLVNYNKQTNTCVHDYFDIIDTEIKAYTLGFFIADGYLNEKSDRFGISIQENDKIVLEFMKKYICPDSNIYTKNRTTSTIKRMNQSTLRWTSKHMKNIFQNIYDINPNKTYDCDFLFPFDKIPNDLIRHFIRGFIDGDGSFDKKPNGFRLTILSTSFVFMKQIGEYITNITEGIEYNIKEIHGKTINYHVLTFNMFRLNKPEKVLKIYNYLYDDSEIYLERKKNIIELYLKYRGKL